MTYEQIAAKFKEQNPSIKVEDFRPASRPSEILVWDDTSHVYLVRYEPMANATFIMGMDVARSGPRFSNEQAIGKYPPQVLDFCTKIGMEIYDIANKYPASESWAVVVFEEWCKGVFLQGLHSIDDIRAYAHFTAQITTYSECRRVMEKLKNEQMAAQDGELWRSGGAL